MKLIVGLGNPGQRYSGTRHNVGFMVAARLAEKWAASVKKSYCEAEIREGSFADHPVRLAQPQTSMNLSGESVACMVRRLKLELSSALIVCDDISLPLGTIRLRAKGSDGGHNGLASIIGAVQSENVPRLRVGIGSQREVADLTAYVLGRFRSSEQKSLEKGISNAVEACEVWITRGMTAAMNSFNRRVECQA